MTHWSLAALCGMSLAVLMLGLGGCSQQDVRAERFKHITPPALHQQIQLTRATIHVPQ